jgi:hypothetical protein
LGWTLALITEPTRADIQRQSDIEENRKKLLEANFRNLFNKWQKKILERFSNIFASGNNVFGVSPEMTEELNELLITHWLKCAEAFVPGLDTGIKTTRLAQKVLDQIDSGVKGYVQVYEPTHLAKIIETTESQAFLSSTIARGEFTSAAEQLNVFNAVYKRKLLGRTKYTSFTETTGPVEAGKRFSLDFTTNALPSANIEDLKDLQKISPNLTFKKLDFKKVTDQERLRKIKQRLSNPMKKWSNLGDFKVRESHQDKPTGIGGTTIPDNEAFHLEGGDLMYPGDQSLGANLGEIIGCRCIVTYI